MFKMRGNINKSNLENEKTSGQASEKSQNSQSLSDTKNGERSSLAKPAAEQGSKLIKIEKPGRVYL